MAEEVHASPEYPSNHVTNNISTNLLVDAIDEHMNRQPNYGLVVVCLKSVFLPKKVKNYSHSIFILINDNDIIQGKGSHIITRSTNINALDYPMAKPVSMP